MSPVAMAALISFVGVLISSLISYLIAQKKLNTENRLDIAAYQAIRKVLQQTDWQMRSFDAIKHHLAGFDDDELRKLLVAAGAVSFTSEEGKELWGLRNEERLKPTAHHGEETPAKAGGGGGAGRYDPGGRRPGFRLGRIYYQRPD